MDAPRQARRSSGTVVSCGVSCGAEPSQPRCSTRCRPAPAATWTLSWACQPRPMHARHTAAHMQARARRASDPTCHAPVVDPQHRVRPVDTCTAVMWRPQQSRAQTSHLRYRHAAIARPSACSRTCRAFVRTLWASTAPCLVCRALPASTTSPRDDAVGPVSPYREVVAVVVQVCFHFRLFAVNKG